MVIVALVCLAYDFLFARPSVNQAFDAVSALRASDPASQLTQADIATVIGHQPMQTFRDRSDLVEVYKWRSGLPTLTHKLYAVYREGGGGEYFFYRHSKFTHERSDDLRDDDHGTSANASDSQHAGGEDEQMLASEVTTYDVPVVQTGASETDEPTR